MINSFKEISIMAREKGPKRIAVLAPEDPDFMQAIKQAYENGLIEPVLIGTPEKMMRLAGDIGFDISGIEIIYESDRQAIADLGTRMLFEGKVDIESKGQISTAYIYKSVIREEAKIGSGRIINVITFWELPDLNRLISFTDGGVNIRPDYKAKTRIVKNAVFALHLLGCAKPRIAVLSAERPLSRNLESYQHFKLLKNAAKAGEFGNCEIIEMNNFHDFFAGENAGVDFPDILLVPNLDTGNILGKLDLILNVIRRAFLITSRGPVLIPSRSDFCNSIFGEIEMGVVVADKIKGGTQNDA